jgi:carbon monoxide dehydrogenase subunit G
VKLEGTIEIAAPARAVWDLIINPISLSACMPGVQDIRQVDDRTFEGTISAAVGPINGNFTFRSVITTADFPDRLIVEVAGSDSVTKSKLDMDVSVGLIERGPSDTGLSYHAVVKVKGRLAILGEMMLRATAGLMIGEVTKCLRSQLEVRAAADAARSTNA